ncbi:hypothetical protein LTR37_020905 [Vermiconidia calcicola]|uniref:Uncharacterized protein n=1 Tax=Vermiconidia calcicola TaxID=1690605 RepID=A0ACC3MB47_9PEZI|nr:hypothetical protein LTR37_020905 [Vermiconidia calcicola]
MILPRLRIAILECDEPVGKTKEKYGTYGGLFTELLQNGATKLADSNHGKKPELDISSWDIVNKDQYPKLEDIDAVLLTGSKFNSFDNDPWILRLVEYTRRLLKQDRVRLIGVCFGHQIIGRALDVKVDRGDKGWEVSVTKVHLTAMGKELFGLEELNIHQMHRDLVYEWPKGVEPLGHTDSCDVQGMYIKEHLITVQGHPEFNGDVVSELLQRRHDQGIFNDEMYNDGMSRVRKPHDGTAVGAAFLRFLLD